MKNSFRKILLIDPDAEPYYEQITSTLTGCEIILSPDHYKACEFYFHNEVDLVLLDHNKRVSCFELIRFFKSLNPLIPVIVMTANGSEDLATKVFRVGARDYLKKPFAVSEFIERIKSALGIINPKINRRTNNIGRAVYCIHKYYNTKIKLPHIAREAGMSISCFERKFKEEKGVTFNKYVNELRISRAKDILREDGLSMNDVAFACGFTNQFHFTRTFKKIAQIAPMDYRKSVKE